jgi:hypothetical protein
MLKTGLKAIRSKLFYKFGGQLGCFGVNKFRALG